MVAKYNDSLADALTPISAIDGSTLSASTEPTANEAAFFWDRGAQRVRMAFFRAGMSPTLTSSSEAEEWAITAEAICASAALLDGNATLFKSQAASAASLMAQCNALLGYVNEDGEWVPGEIDAMRQVLLANGATEQLPAADSRLGSWQTRNQAPTTDLTPGGDDVPYAEVAVTFEDGSDL